MRRTSRLLAFVCVFFGAMQAAWATVRVHIDIDTQTMSVTSGSGDSYEWPVSTARAGYSTPRGTFRPQRMMKVAFSAKYHNSPMPHSIFFTGGYAIHGSYATGSLGRPASHGCVRLAPGNAATLFSMVKAEGAVISITGSGGRTYVASRHHKDTRIAMHKHHKGTRLAKLHRSNSSGYLAYAPDGGSDVGIKSWLKHPNRGR